jgi:pyruvate dehydrogenase E2 component (dihydrolipoamide acetyltransferase)
MHVIRMPKATPTTSEATVERWLKAEGDPVEKDQVVLEARTPDAAVELVSAASGTLLKVLAAEGTVVAVDEPLGLVGKASEDVASAVAVLEDEASPAAPGEESEVTKKRQSKSPGRSQAAAPPQEGAKGEAATEAAPAAPAEASAPSAGAVTPIVMPQVGNTMEEGTIVAWRVKEGDSISVGDIIFDVETDKATVEIEAVDAGRLARVVAAEGETVPIKEPVAYLADNDADVDAYLAAEGRPAEQAPAAEKAEAQPAGKTEAPAAAPQPAAPQPQAPAAAPSGGRVKASPAARRRAAERGIDLAAIAPGSGPGGRVTTSDVEGAGAAAAGPVRRKMTSMRSAIGKALLHSKQTIPHFYARLTIDAGALFDAYQQVKAAGEFKCSVNDFVVLAAARAMREFPAFRSRLEGDEIVEMPSANVGIAVGTEAGLVVPVLVGVERMTFRQLAGETRRVVEAARGGRLEGVGKGLVTITNLGMYGVEEFAAIINPPEVAILAVGAIREEAIVTDGAIRPGRAMTITLSADHRVIDGVVGAQFLARLKELLEAAGELL